MTTDQYKSKGDNSRTYACSRFARLNCERFGKKTVCDKDGKTYTNMCEFKKAQCANSLLKPADCEEESGEGSGEKMSKFESKCVEVMKETCSKDGPRWSRYCDADGNVYKNRCLYNQAKCANPDMKPAACPRPTRPPTKAPEPTEPKPTRRSFETVICQRMKSVDCATSKERKICDAEGNEYRNRCAFTKARCLDKTIKQQRCKRESVDDVMFDEETGKVKGTYACSRFARLNCERFGKKAVCDKDGKTYTNMCEFKKAQCANSLLKPADCEEESGEGSGEKMSKFESKCVEVMKETCSKDGPRWSRYCDADGNVYKNRCLYNQAKCANPDMEPAACSRPTRPPTKAPEPTEPKPTRRSFETVMCQRMKSVDCATSKEWKTCDAEGNEYRNRCAFTKARCIDKTIKQQRCKRENVDDVMFDEEDKVKVTFEQKACQRLAPVDCSKFQKQRGICDASGKKYTNRCAYNQARCANPDLKRALCPRPTRQPTQAPEPTEPKPTRRSFEKVMCQRMKSIDCATSEKKKICDAEGNTYKNRCAFTKAKCLDKTIKQQKCKQESVDDVMFDEETDKVKVTFEQKACQRLAPVDCSKFQKQRGICDASGKKYLNRCSYNQAKCANTDLKRALCPRPTRPPTQAPEPTEPKPTRRSFENVMCQRMKSIDCATAIERKICDAEGNTYKNRCAFTKAKCLDKTIKQQKCKQESVDDVMFDEETDKVKLTAKERACKRLAPVDCSKFEKQRGICDASGKKYMNRCAFKKAKCADETLKAASCAKPTAEGSGDKLIKFQTRCQEIAKKDCTQERVMKVCDTDGNKYRSMCSFTKAKCANPEIKRTACERPTRPPTQEPKPTDPKPTRKNLVCRKMKSVDCNTMKEKKMCDAEGNEYRNRCAFTQARCLNNKLRGKMCKDTGVEEDVLFDQPEGNKRHGKKEHPTRPPHENGSGDKEEKKERKPKPQHGKEKKERPTRPPHEHGSGDKEEEKEKKPKLIHGKHDPDHPGHGSGERKEKKERKPKLEKPTRPPHEHSGHGSGDKEDEKEKKEKTQKQGHGKRPIHPPHEHGSGSGEKEDRFGKKPKHEHNKLKHEHARHLNHHIVRPTDVDGNPITRRPLPTRSGGSSRFETFCQRTAEEDFKCPSFARPVCGSDGVTYDNRCFMLAAQCKDDSVALASRGKC